MSNKPIILVADKTVITYITLLTKTEAKMVLVNLRDMSNKAIERLLGKLVEKSGTGNARRYREAKTWTYIEYPGTEIRFRVDIRESIDYQLSSKHREEHQNKFLAHMGIERPVYDKKKRAWIPDYVQTWTSFQNWCETNPDSNQGYDYSCIRVEFKYNPRNNNITISQDEIDTILIEDILFGENDDEPSSDK